jgi:hypothetical protein
VVEWVAPVELALVELELVELAPVAPEVADLELEKLVVVELPLGELELIEPLAPASSASGEASTQSGPGKPHEYSAKVAPLHRNQIAPPEQSPSTERKT